jgi:hypothetical protein
VASGGMMKRILGIGVALVVALGAGWVWGASGRSDLNRALRIAELRDGLLEGRAAVLDARLDIYSVNFGEASRHLEAARSALRPGEDRRGAAHGRSAQSGCERAGGRRVESDRGRARHHHEALTRGSIDGTDRWFVTA